MEDSSIDQSSDKLSESARDRTRGANLKQSENLVKSIVATCFIALLQHLANFALSHICHGFKSKFHHFGKVSEAVSRFKSIGKQMDPKCLN